MSGQSTIATVASALAQSGISAGTIRLETLSVREIENSSVVRMRSVPGLSPDPLQGDKLPGQTGTCMGDDPAVLCLRPGEWLFVSTTMPARELLGHVEHKFDNTGCFIWDESDGLALLRLGGKAAPWLLRKHCGLELPDSGETQGRCAQSRFAHISVLMHYHADEQTRAMFDLYVDRSLARYVWELLAATAPHACELLQSLDVTNPAQS